MRKIKSIKEIEPFDIYDITVDVDHCFELFNGVIAHNSLFPKAIVGGGQGSYYGANDIWILGRQQDKKDKDLLGYHFVINIEKSRLVKEKAKIAVTVSFEGGIKKHSGLLDVAVEGKFIDNSTKGKYQAIDQNTGELIGPFYKEADLLDNSVFWDPILNNIKFKTYVHDLYSLGGDMFGDETK